MNLRTGLASVALTLAFIPTHAQQPATPPQQIIQVGALNIPTAVLTPDDHWSPLIPILSTSDRDLFIEDPSNDAWLSQNAPSFLDRGQYTLTLVSFYKSRRPCREDQIRTGLSDAAHVNACDNYRYRVSQVAVDSPQNDATLRFSAMVLTGGALDTGSVLHETHTRGFSELSADAQKALSEATKLIAKQSSIYAARHQNGH